MEHRRWLMPVKIARVNVRPGKRTRNIRHKRANSQWRLTMTRFLFFFVLVERHRVVAPTSARPLATAVPAL